MIYLEGKNYYVLLAEPTRPLGLNFLSTALIPPHPHRLKKYIIVENVCTTVLGT